MATATATLSGRPNNLGPLTTTEWNPPADCSSVQAACSTCNGGWLGQSCMGESDVSDNKLCWPTTAKGVPPTSGALYGWGLYSPGIVCPSGYTTAGEATYGGLSNYMFDFPLEPSETGVACCPEGGFRATSDANGQTCLKAYSSTTLKAGNCHDGGRQVYSEVTVPYSIHGETASLYIVRAPLFQIVWKASDLPVTNSAGVTTLTTSNSASSPPSSQPTVSAAGSSATADAGSDSGSSSNSDTGLTPGAKAGVAIGVILGALIVAAGAFLVWRRSRRDREGGGIGRPKGTSELPGYMSKPGEAGEPPTEIQSRPWGTRGVVEVNPDYPVEMGSSSPEPKPI